MSKIENTGRPVGLDRAQIAATLDEYRRLYDEGEGGDLAARKKRYETVVNNFYDLVTDFYQFGWGNSFHFAPRRRGESFRDSIVRCEHVLADRLELKPGMKVLDVGCGVGGPLCEIARYSGAAVVGINNNPYQVGKAEKLIAKNSLASRCSVVRGDFMRMSVADREFDAAYTEEATPHAPDKVGVYKEIFRVLKPGGRFAGYEWCLTERFDPADPEHHGLKRGIEIGTGLPDLATASAIVAAFKTAGFEVQEARDVALDSDPETPWYRALEGRDLTFGSLPRTPLGRALTKAVVRGLEALRLAPRGTAEVSALLNQSADDLVAAGKRGIFTPLLFFVVRRPSIPSS